MPSTIKGLIFDFDGLILDTEGPDYQAWQDVFHECGAELPIEVWSECIGRPADFFDPIAYLEGQIHRPLDRQAVSELHRRRHDQLLMLNPILPGIAPYLEEAKRLGLRTAIASSSSSGWVTTHLGRLGIHSAFECLACREHVKQGKPDPQLYLLALDRMGLSPHEAIALEDSPNGVAAAKSAGIFCVAVPNPLTARLDLSAADLLLTSLQDMELRELIGLAEVLPA